VFADDDECSGWEFDGSLDEARSELCAIVRRSLRAGRKVHEADVYEGDMHRMSVPVDCVVGTGSWETWCATHP
jgi:hypothetical protein